MYESPVLRSYIPEYMKIEDEDYQECLRTGKPVVFKTLEDEINFYIMLGWNACVTQMKENADVIESI